MSGAVHTFRAAAHPAMLTELHEVLDMAIGSATERMLDRLTAPSTTVTFQVLARPRYSATLSLDTPRPSVASASEIGEIVIAMDQHDGLAFGHGLLVLPNAILNGRVTSTGPVRKYLNVDPIMRGLLRNLGRRV